MLYLQVVLGPPNGYTKPAPGSPETQPYKYDQVTFNKEENAIQWSKDSIFKKLYWDTWTSTWHTAYILSKI